MKKIFKMLLSLVVVLPMALSFVACKDKDADNTEKKTLTRTQPNETSSALLETPSSFRDLIRSRVQGYKVGIVDSKLNSNFYNTVIFGGEYAYGAEPHGYANWSDVIQNHYSYYEMSTGNSTYYPSDYYPLVLPNVDFTTIENDPDYSPLLELMKNTHRKLNLHHYLVNDAEFNRNYKLINILPTVNDIDSVSVMDIKTNIADTPKINGLYYEFLTKPMPLMYSGTVIVYDFADVVNNKVTDKITRVYVEAGHGLCLGADRLEKVKTGNITTTYYDPIFRTYLSIFNI